MLQQILQESKLVAKFEKELKQVQQIMDATKGKEAAINKVVKDMN